MKWSVLFFDLDDTLYPTTSGLWAAIRQRMTDYMHTPLGFSTEEIPTIREHYFKTYGTTLRGLQIHHNVDPDDYLAYVHDLPLEKFLTPDPHLREILISLPQMKWIFTNADANHAKRVLDILGLEGCFNGIIDVRSLDYLCKPEKEAFQRALDLSDAAAPEDCVLFDDSLRNLIPARTIGFTTVLVGSDGNNPGANYSLIKLTDLPQVFPELWQPSDPLQ